MPEQGGMEKSSEPHGQFVNLHMMNFTKYIQSTTGTVIMIRLFTYPFLHSTILQQAQRGNEKIFGGFWDVFQREGVYGVYRGASFRVFGQALGAVAYLYTYERMQESIGKEKKEDWHKFIAGGVASIPSYCIQTPFEIINQHVVLLSKKAITKQEASILKGLQALRVAKEIRHSTSWWRLEKAVIQEIYRTIGYRGFWRSVYFALSINCFNSGLFWFLLTKYSNKINTLFPGLEHQQILPGKTRMLTNTMSGILSSISVTLITNPAFIIKTRSQLGHIKTTEAFLSIYRQEKWTVFFIKGLVPRLKVSLTLATFGILGYENVKEFSVKKEYERTVKW